MVTLFVEMTKDGTNEMHMKRAADGAYAYGARI